MNQAGRRVKPVDPCRMLGAGVALAHTHHGLGWRL